MSVGLFFASSLSPDKVEADHLLHNKFGRRRSTCRCCCLLAEVPEPVQAQASSAGFKTTKKLHGEEKKTTSLQGQESFDPVPCA